MAPGVWRWSRRLGGGGDGDGDGDGAGAGVGVGAAGGAGAGARCPVHGSVQEEKEDEEDSAQGSRLKAHGCFRSKAWSAAGQRARGV